MTTEQLIGLALALVVMAIGVLGSVLPGIPSTPIVVVAAIAHKIYFKEQGAHWWILLLMVLMAGLTFFLDHLASMYGAKKLGATWRGVVGAVIGGLIGLFFGLPGLLIGPFLGALLLEMTGGRAFKESARAGLGATLGLLAGALGKLLCCTLMIGIFIVSVLMKSG